MARAPRGLKAKDQPTAGSTHQESGLLVRATQRQDRGTAGSATSVHALTPGSESPHAGSNAADLSREDLTLHLDCIKLTGERLPLGIAFPRFLDIVRRVVPFDHGTVYLAEGAAGALIPVVIKGNRVDLADQVRFAKGPGLSAWVAQEGRPVVIPHPVHSVDQRPFADKGIRAFAAIPLLEHGRVVAVMALTRTEEVFAEPEFEFLVRSSNRLGATLARVRLQAQYRTWTHTDEETGLSAWHHFVARMEAEIDRARHQASEFSVVVITLDAPSPRTGERLTRLFAERLQSGIRSCDMATLMDDGAFGVLLAGVNRETAERILKRIATVTVKGIPALTPPAVTLWGGVAACSEAGASVEEFLERARSSLTRVA